MTYARIGVCKLEPCQTDTYYQTVSNEKDIFGGTEAKPSTFSKIFGFFCNKRHFKIT